jgi:hypothetical protein
LKTYYYQWADGSITICVAKNKVEARDAFDEEGEVAMKLIKTLKSFPHITLKKEPESKWIIDELGEDFLLELWEKGYPNHYKLDLGDATIEEEIVALKKDAQEAKSRIKATVHVDGILLLMPRNRN